MFDDQAAHAADRIGTNFDQPGVEPGDLEHYRIGGRAVIAEADAVAWLESHRISKRPRLGRRPNPEPQ